MEMLLFFMGSCIVLLAIVAYIEYKQIATLIALVTEHEERLDAQHENLYHKAKRIHALENRFAKQDTYSSALAQNTVPPYLPTDLLKKEIARREFSPSTLNPFIKK